MAGNHVALSTVGSGLALGALGMYLFDPAQGRTRRARLRDKLVRLEHRSEDAARTTRRDVRNRARGLWAELRARVRPGPVDDQILVERVRSKIGRIVSHPHAVLIEAHDGTILLRGDVLAGESAPLVMRVRAVRGVHTVDNQLTPHPQAFGVPALQGGRELAPLAPSWTPASRLLALVGGLALLARGLRGGGFAGLLLGIAGASVLLRGLTGLPAQRWLERALPHAVERA